MTALEPPTRICVFCSTQTGAAPSGPTAARELAAGLHARGIELVYGGGSTGLMGEVARERVRLGGPHSVIGVTPYDLVESEREGRGMSKSPGGARMSSGASEDPGVAALCAASEDVFPMPEDNVYGRAVGVPSLSRRKAVMMELVTTGGPGSGFIALPGGFGSLDEVLEVVTARQMGMHALPMVLCNVDGFWDGFVAWMDRAVETEFLRMDSREIVKVVDGVDQAIEALATP
jgi:uncharacterized protein (TIGR00730 family)